MKLLIIFLFVNFNYIGANEKNNIRITNDKTFSGPMGMGLSRSYELGGKKICLYNTINGQEKILNNILKDCPDNIEKSNKLE